MSKTTGDKVLMARGAIQHVTRKADIPRFAGYGYHIVETARKGNDGKDKAPEAAAENTAPEAAAEAAAEPQKEAPKRKAAKKGGADA